jgi:hypothetical protein
MSYNGIGLATVRGTATSGHVQYNAGHVRNSSRFHRTWRNANGGGGGGRGDGGGGRNEASSRRNKLLTDEAIREGANSIALHEKKRQLEARLFELRKQLEDGGTMKDTEIDEEVEWERKKTLDQWAKEEKEVEERKERLLLLGQQKELESANDNDQIGGGARENVKLITATGDAKSDDVVDQPHPPRQRRWDNPERRRENFDHEGGKLGRQSPPSRRGGGGSQTNSQARQMELERRNDRLRDAFGINAEKHQEGEAFDRELQQAKKMEKQKKRELVEKAKRKDERAAIREKRREDKVKRKEEKREGGEVDNGGKKTKTKNNSMRNGKHSKRARSPSSSSSSSSYSSSSSSGSSRSYSSSSRSDRSYSSSSYSDASRRGRRGRVVKRSSHRRGRRSDSSFSHSSRSYSSGSYSSRSRSSDDDDHDKKLRALTRKGAATVSKENVSDSLRQTKPGANNSLSIPPSSSDKDNEVDKGVASARGTVSDIDNGGRGSKGSRWGDKPASEKAMSHRQSQSPSPPLRNRADETGKKSKKRSSSPFKDESERSRSPKPSSARDGKSDAKSVRRDTRRSPSYSNSPSRSSSHSSSYSSGSPSRSRSRSPSSSSSVEGAGRKARNHTQHKDNRKSAPPSRSPSISDSSSRQQRRVKKRGRGSNT